MLEPSELSTRIDSDVGLGTSRKFLIYTSLILLALIFSGAKIVEANTFLFKLTFSNPSGLSDLLLLSVGFLLVRYHSNASKYHSAIYEDWTSKLLNKEFFYACCEHSDGQYGYLVDIAPSYAGYNDDEFRYDEYSSLKVSFKTNLFFNAQFQFDLFDRHGHMQDQRVYIFSFSRLTKSFKALGVVFKMWWEAQVRYRESLDIYAPYFIAWFSILASVLFKIN